MLKRTLCLFLASLSLLSFACGDDDDGGDDTNGSTTPAGATSTAPDGTGEPATEAPDDGDPDTVCGTNPDPATDETTLVTNPAEGDSVTSPLTVEGQIAAFEAAFNMALLDANGAAISVGNGMATEGQTLAPFSGTLQFSVQEETPAWLWVYDQSAENGEPIHVRQVEILLLPEA